MRLPVSVVVVLAAVACHKDPPPAPIVVAAAPAPSPRDSGVLVIVTVDAGSKPTVTASSSKAPAEDSEAIAAFARDCHHTFTSTADQMGGEPLEKPECESRDFEQNCVPDQSGCWDALQACKDGCSAPCSRCQTVCGDACDSCATRCAGDGGCRAGCARERQVCRYQCLSDLNSCRGTTCENQANDCNEKAAAEVAKKCPDCKGISSCIESARGQPGYTPHEDEAKCLLQFPKANRECELLCDPGQ